MSPCFVSASCGVGWGGGRGGGDEVNLIVVLYGHLNLPGLPPRAKNNPETQQLCPAHREDPAICFGSEPCVCLSVFPLAIPPSWILPPAMTRFSYAEYFSLFHSCPAPSRSTVPPENSPASGPMGLFQGVMQKYRNSQLAPVDPVLKAIKEGDEEALKAMIKAGKNLAEPNKEGWLPLHEAAYYGQLSCLKALQQAYPAVIDQRTLQEETALYLATCRGHLDCLQSLLQAGAEPDISNKSRETPLYKACERKNAEAVRMLVQYNADTNHRCNRGWTALHESVSRNDLEVMEILVSRGAKVESKNAYGITPLFVAAQSGQLEALRFLAKYGADINTQASDCASALYEACKNEHEDVVEFLLSQGADANKANKDGMLPLHIASKKGNYRIVQMLLPVTSRTRVRRSGISPLHLAAERNHDAVLEALLGARFDVNAPLAPERARLYEDRRSSALYFAVVNNNVYATELLLLAGADPNRDVISPLLVAIRHGCLRTMQLLLDHGANIDAYIATHPTAFPATIMFAMKYLSLLKFLMDLGCDGEPCFSCLYGNGPHPPVPPPSSRFRDAPATDKAPGAVQQTCARNMMLNDPDGDGGESRLAKSRRGAKRDPEAGRGRGGDLKSPNLK
uniref:Ankyrin repeat and SOCS box containing 2 n=1 Tax=Felis catus TaxID=9685 RepID=A0ABI7XBL0_FELCA